MSSRTVHGPGDGVVGGGDDDPGGNGPAAPRPKRLHAAARADAARAGKCSTVPFLISICISSFNFEMLKMGFKWGMTVVFQFSSNLHFNFQGWGRYFLNVSKIQIHERLYLLYLLDT